MPLMPEFPAPAPPLFCIIDADSVLEPMGLFLTVRRIMESSENVLGVGATIGIVNGCKIQDGQVVEFGLPDKFIPLVQVVEYVRSFFISRLAGSYTGTLALISGAFGIFRSDIAIAVGGYDVTTVGEDLGICHQTAPAHDRPRNILCGILYSRSGVPDPSTRNHRHAGQSESAVATRDDGNYIASQITDI